MANNYFKFKQFIIYHDECGMKVCTDACIFGAWAAEKIKNELSATQVVLDIGTGSGLLSLMLAQKSQAVIEAIEIDEGAFKQAGDNFKRSLWSERLHIFHADAKYFSSERKYDFIISNPPFYENDLLSSTKNKNVARHDEGLKFDELILTIKKNLHTHGSFALLLPYHRINYFEDIAEKNHFFLKEKLLIKPTPAHDFFRGILLFTQTKTSPLINELIIKNYEAYSEDLVCLMKDYYLNL
ncbi:MAG: methyltransferase [Ginsengibacter sp.]